MAKVTIQPHTLDIPWRHPSTSPQLRIFLNKPAVSSDGLVLENGSTQNGIFYRAYTCSVAGGKLTIPQITDIDSLTDALVGSDATYSAYFYASSAANAQQVCPYQGFTRFSIPNLPATTTWAALLQFNSTFIPFNDAFTYSRTQIDSKIAGIVPVPLGGVPFILQAPTTGFTSAQALNSLTPPGILKNDAMGHIALAVADTDYQKPISVNLPLTLTTDTVGIGGLSTLGTANQVVGMNAGAIGFEYKSLATGTAGSDFAIAHSANTVTFNLPTASASNRGALSSTDWSTFNNKQAALTLPLSGAQGGTGVANTGFTITLAGNLTTSGTNPLTLTTTGSTNVTLPTSGTLVNTGVTSLASLATVGTIGTGIWQGTAVGQTYGGTGLDTHLVTDGQLLIGQTSDHAFGLATLTAGTNITITNAGHAITINSSAVAGSRWDQLTAAAGDVTLANSTFKTAFTFGNINGANSWSETYGALSGTPTVNQHTVLDLTGNTNLGALFNINTVGTSTALPLQVTAQGTVNGWNVDTGGIIRAKGTGGIDAAAIITGIIPAARITQVGTVATGVWQGTVIASQYGGTGQNWSASNGLPSLNSGAWSLNTITTNGVAFGAAGNLISFTAAGNNAVFLTTGAGVPILGAVSANLSIATSTLDTVQGIQTTSSPRFAGLGIGQGAPTNSVGITGQTITTQANLAVMSLQTGGSLTSNDANVREYYDTFIQPTINTPGGSGKTFVALGLNLIETSVVGTARYFVKAYINSVPGTVKWSVDDSGNEVLAGSINKVTITPPATGSTLTIADGKTATFNASPTFSNNLTFAGTDGTTLTFQATDTYVGRVTTDTLTNKTLTSSTNVLGGVTMTLGSDATGDIYYRSGGVLTRLPIGTAGQGLVVSGGLPAWSTGGTGTITSGSAGQIPYYTAGTTVSAMTNATWTDGSNLLTVNYAGITSLTNSILLKNSTAATVGNKLQFAPALHQQGTVWDQTLASPASRTYDLTLSGSALSPKQTAITNVVTTSFLGNSVAKVTAAGHNLTTGQKVVIQGVTGTLGFTTSVNGTWPVAVIDANTFWLIGTNANSGVYSTGGTVAAQAFGTQAFSYQYNAGGYTQGMAMNSLGQIWIGPTVPTTSAAFSVTNGPSVFVDNTGGTVLTQGTQPGSNLAQDLRVNNYFGTTTTTTDMYQYVMLVEGLQSVGAGNSQALVGVGVNVLGTVTGSSIWGMNPGTVVTTNGLTITQRTVEADLNTSSTYVPVQVGTAGFSSVFEATSGGGHTTCPFDTATAAGSGHEFAEGLYLRSIGYAGGPFQSNNAIVDFASNTNTTQYGLNAANQGANNQAAVNGAVVHGDNNQVISSALNAARNADLAISRYDTSNNLLMGDSGASALISQAPFLAGGTVGGNPGSSTLTIKGTSGGSPAGAGHILLNPLVGGAAFGTVFIGAAAAEQVNANDLLHLRGPDGSNALAFWDVYNNNSAVNSKFSFRTARGTAASPSALQANDVIGGFTWRVGQNTTVNAPFSGQDTARIYGFAAENITTSAWGTGLQFFTTATGTINNASESMRIQANGGVQINLAQAVPVAADFLNSAPNSAIIYVHANKLVIASNSGGTTKFVSIPLDGSTGTWTNGTGALP